MANILGKKWNKGGSMSRKSMLSVDFSNFAEYAEKLDLLGANLKDVFSKAMQEAAEKVQEETLVAIDDANLPASGKYSKGDTMQAVIDNLIPRWEGSVGEVRLGFDKTKPGAGGFLITGTPKMRPDMALADIYGSKRYENQLKKSIEKALQAEIDRIMGG